ncbi:hypothetical protein [Tenacibaculum sp. UWU-22]|uniref:hypothetical protein n=1 Tax=Tenacibaculum sp. UWU-22 TaxID=3234187 RepID=UPI0034DAD64C
MRYNKLELENATHYSNNQLLINCTKQIDKLIKNKLCIMKQIFTIILLLIYTVTFSQTKNTEGYDWPYKMPIWGKKAAAKGYKIQLPYGLNVNYVYNRMDLEITRFNMLIGDDPNSKLNQLITKYVTLDNLHFNKTIAKANGMNLRADVWVLPFWNIYGIYSNNQGSTEVSLEPRWYNKDGNLVLSVPNVYSKVNFSSNSYGIGSTIVTPIYKTLFFSLDGNTTWSHSDLLTKRVVFGVISTRLGNRIRFNNGMMIALYIGAMYRGFLDHQNNNGSILMQKAMPNLSNKVTTAINQQIQANNDEIDQLDPNNPKDKIQIIILQNKNNSLKEIRTAFNSLMESQVNYSIRKDIINHWSVNFGFNYEINPELTFRGEFGKGSGNDFVLIGLQYRFGF